MKSLLVRNRRSIKAHPSRSGVFIRRLASILLGWSLATSLCAETIPPVHCDSLAGQRVNLPDDLHGRGAVLVIGFSRESQAAVRDWSRRLASDYGDSPTVSFYELAMLAAVPRLARPLVVRAIRKVVNPEGQTHFLPIMEDEGTWRRVAHYNRSEAAYVVVVDPTGAVRWSTSGAINETAYRELKKHLVP